MSRGDKALRLLCRWRGLIDTVAALPDLDPTSPRVVDLLPAFVELADDTDRFIDDATDGREARS
jgi:hypothetical protein